MKNKTQQTTGWLDNFNDSKISLPPGFVGEGTFNGPQWKSPAWGGQFQMGGNVYPVNYVPEAQGGMSLPGAIGSMYARIGAPSKGPRRNQTDVTDASAQNGKEMQYYQNGLDWKPKSISKNGAWLDGYDVAQGGTNLPSVRDLITDTINRKIQAHKGKGKETVVTKKDNTKTVTPKEIKKLTGKQQNELAQRQSEEQANKDWVQGSMEEAYKSPLMSPGYFTPEGVAIGALQGATKLGPDLYEGNYKAAAIDALTTLPITGKYISQGVTAAGKALGTEEGLLSNAYKYNPWAFKPNPESYYRGIGKTGLDDALESRYLRANNNKLYGEDVYMTPEFNMAKGQYSRNQPYSVGDRWGDDWKMVKPTDSKSYIAEIPKNKLTNPEVKGKLVTINKGPLPIDDVKLYKQDWLQGYKEVPKQEDGGIIKDDNGYWNPDNWGKDVEIDQSDPDSFIDMEGVYEPLLGVSDKGEERIMYPGEKHKFKKGTKKVIESRIAKNGLRQEQKGLQNLDNLTNFTNYNKPQPGGWLSKYE